MFLLLFDVKYNVRGFYFPKTFSKVTFNFEHVTEFVLVFKLSLFEMFTTEKVKSNKVDSFLEILKSINKHS